MAGDSGIRCRQIRSEDRPAVAALLARGFPRRPERYWLHALDALARRTPPEGFPQFGFVLEQDGAAMGVVLTIYQAITHAAPPYIRCNLTSWYVEPALRSHAALLAMVALRRKEVTYLNTSPAPNTWPTIEAQGYVRYTGGQVVALPLLASAGTGRRVERFRASEPAHAALPEATLLADHAATGCLSLVGRGPDGPRPFVLMPMRLKQGRIPFPGMQLVFCRGLADVAAFARPLGRMTARLGRPVLVVDSDGPLPGLPGWFWRDRQRKYVKGPQRPWLGDIAYTEFTLFGP